MGNCASNATSGIRARASPFPRELPLAHHITDAEADCPMLRSLHSDADAQAHLTTFMQLPSLAQLYNSCKLWRRWLILPQQSGHRHVTRTVNYTAESLPHMLRCKWLLQAVTEMSSSATDSGRQHHTELEKLTGQQQLVRYLQSLPRFAKMDSLLVRFDSVFLPPPPQLRSLLLSFAGQLRSLTVRPFDHDNLVGIAAFSAHLPLFERLETLVLLANVERSEMDLATLPTLKCLRTFRFEYLFSEQVSVVQARHLAQCRSLTSLEFGSWGPRRAGDPDNVAPLSIFVNSRFANEAPGSASSSSSIALAPVATLTHFMFLHNELTAAGWDQLSRLSSLKTTLYLTLHDLSITKEAWSRLGHFTQLTELHVSSPNPLNDNFKSDSLALITDHIWPSILQMQALRELRVSRCNLQPHHITSLVSLPALWLTVFPQCHLLLEDLAVVSAVCTPQRKIWLVSSSYGEQRTEVQNVMFPIEKEERRW